MKETNQRFSIIDGSIEERVTNSRFNIPVQLVPIFKDIQVKRVGLDGEELVTQRVIIGFCEKEEEK